VWNHRPAASAAVSLPCGPCGRHQSAPAGWFGAAAGLPVAAKPSEHGYWSRLSGPCSIGIDTAGVIATPGSRRPAASRQPKSNRPRQTAPISRQEPPRWRSLGWPRPGSGWWSATPGGCANSALSSADLQQQQPILSTGMELWRKSESGSGAQRPGPRAAAASRRARLLDWTTAEAVESAPLAEAPHLPLV